MAEGGADSSKERMSPDEILNALISASLPKIRSVGEVRQQVQFLAHYTSINALHGICRSGELWFSNPQFMNDLQEMMHGVRTGYEYAIQTRVIEEAFPRPPEETYYHRQQFANAMREFMSTQASEVYVFCTTAHDPNDYDGDLAMWRGYGEGGRGAALIFNTNFLRDHGDSPLLIAEVQYLNDSDRLRSIWELLQIWKVKAKELHKPHHNEPEINVITQSLFVSLLILALTTKHLGFKGEREWRLIYLPFLGNAEILRDGLSYFIGPNGVQPKLKFPLTPMRLDPPEDWTFSSILNKILIGPGMSDRLHRAAIERMLTDCGRSDFRDRLQFSTIPLRV